MEPEAPLLRTQTGVAIFQLGEHKTTHIHSSHEFQNLLCCVVQAIFHANLLYQILNLIHYTENMYTNSLWILYTIQPENNPYLFQFQQFPTSLSPKSGLDESTLTCLR